MPANLLEYVALPKADRGRTASAPAANDDDRVEMVTRRGDGTAEVRVVPVEVARLFLAALDRLEAGGRVALLEDDAELTPNEVAEIVGMSRPLVVRRMEAGDLPFRWVGSHRRSRLADVLAFKARVVEQQNALDALAADTDELREKHGL